MYLSLEERKKILETIWEEGQGKAVIYAQVGGTTLENTLELAEHALRTGVDGIGVLTPTFYPLTDEELEEYYVTVAGAVPEDFPVYIYAIPGCAVNDVTPELAAGIAQKCRNVVGIKYSKNDMIRYYGFRQIRNGDFSVMVAPLDLAYPALSVGCDGIVSGTCLVFTEEIRAMYTAYRKGKREEALRLHEDLSKRAKLLEQQELKKCKVFLHREGVIASDAMRAPLKQLGENEKECFYRGMEGYKKEFMNRKEK